MDTYLIHYIARNYQGKW